VYLYSVVLIASVWIFTFRNRNHLFKVDPQCYLCVSENSSYILHQFVFLFLALFFCSSPVSLTCLFYDTQPCTRAVCELGFSSPPPTTLSHLLDCELLEDRGGPSCLIPYQI
jgi:hypothetical protein